MSKFTQVTQLNKATQLVQKWVKGTELSVILSATCQTTPYNTSRVKVDYSLWIGKGQTTYFFSTGQTIRSLLHNAREYIEKSHIGDKI